jgi:putative glutathione S-transferase
MGMPIEGTWKEVWYDTKSSRGRFTRADSSFRELRADASTAYGPAVGRYHLYVSCACLWAHRTLIFRKLKRLEAHLGIGRRPAQGGRRPDATARP